MKRMELVEEARGRAIDILKGNPRDIRRDAALARTVAPSVSYPALRNRP